MKSHKEACFTRTYSCDQCSYTSKYLSQIRKHETSHHAAMCCSICEKHFSTEARLENHMMTKHGSSIKCDFCEKTFTTRRAKSSHTKLKHTHENLHRCQYCDKTTTSQAKLILHEKTHTEVKAPKYMCRECGYTCVLRKEMDQHNKVAHPKMYVIDSECAKEMFELSRGSNRCLGDLSDPIRKRNGQRSLMPGLKKFWSQQLTKLKDEIDSGIHHFDSDKDSYCKLKTSAFSFMKGFPRIVSHVVRGRGITDPQVILGWDAGLKKLLSTLQVLRNPQ